MGRVGGGLLSIGDQILYRPTVRRGTHIPRHGKRDWSPAPLRGGALDNPAMPLEVPQAEDVVGVLRGQSNHCGLDVAAVRDSSNPRRMPNSSGNSHPTSGAAWSKAPVFCSRSGR